MSSLFSDCGEVSQEMQGKINAYASALGLLLNQNAVAWHSAHAPREFDEANGIDVRLSSPDILKRSQNPARIRKGRLATPDEITRFYDAIREISGHDEFAPIATPNGFRVLNFGGDNKTFHSQVENALHAAFLDDPNTVPVWGAFSLQRELH